MHWLWKRQQYRLFLGTIQGMNKMTHAVLSDRIACCVDLAATLSAISAIMRLIVCAECFCGSHYKNMNSRGVWICGRNASCEKCGRILQYGAKSIGTGSVLISQSLLLKISVWIVVGWIQWVRTDHVRILLAPYRKMRNREFGQPSNTVRPRAPL